MPHPVRGRQGEGPDARLALREALAGLASPDLQQQSVFAAETVLRSADAPVLDFFLKEALRMADCQSGSVRRLRYRLAAQALRAHGAAPGPCGSLLAVRDLLIARVGLEDNSAAAAELAALAGQLAAACIEAYCQGHYAALGVADKDSLSRGWLSELLLAPLLRSACRGPARTRVANACLMARGVLLELGRWARSAGVLHAAVDCLKQMLKLTATGALALCASEALLPVQSCAALLGPRLKAAALEGILQLCTQAMQRSEWQVRKAAADTLAALAEALLAGSAQQGRAALDAAALPAARGAFEQQQVQQQQQHQQQGLDALEGIAPAMAAAVEEHLKYDRIPQVRQAAAALLQLLQRVPGMQQEQRPPPQQLAAGSNHGAAIAGSTAGNRGVDAEPKVGGAPASVPAAPLLGNGRGNLKAVIAERRRQLQQSSWEQAAAAIKARPAGSAGGGGGKAGTRVGTAEEGGGIPAWTGVEDMQGQAQAGVPASESLQGQKERLPGAGNTGGRPPSADAFAATAAAMQRLHDPAQASGSAAGKRRRGWGSLPASPAKQGGPAAAARRTSRDAPVQVLVPRSLLPAAHADVRQDTATDGAGDDQQLWQQSVWRQNPLAQSAEDPLDRTVAAGQLPGGAVPCVHHVEHSQFQLRLQATPPSADLIIAAGSSDAVARQAAALQSVRFWAQESGADVGIEFVLSSNSDNPTAFHRYWVCNGQLHHVQPTFAEAGGSRAQPAAPAAAPSVASPTHQPPRQQDQHTPVACVPSLLPEQQQARSSSSADVPLLVHLAEAPAGPRAESPLASLATAALPSFSPDKQTPVQAKGQAAVAGAKRPETAAAAAPIASTPAHGTADAAASTPRMTAPGWRGSVELPAAGARSGSPALQGHASAVHWAALLRPAGEQLLPGLPDWDRSRAGMPGAGSGGCSSSRAGSRSASPNRAGSRPSSPLQGGSRPAAPSRQSAAAAGRQQWCGQQAAAPPPEHQQLHQEPRDQQHAQRQQPNSRQEAQQGGDACGGGPGPLTAMITKAVSRLQQFHELEEELQLPGGASLAALAGAARQPAVGRSRAGTQAGPPAQRRRQEAEQDSRRSLEPVLSAIQEGASEDNADAHTSGGSRLQQGAGATGGTDGRLRRLQEQLQLNMDEIQQRIDAQQGPSNHVAAAGAAAEAEIGPDTFGSDEMPAAWDAQEELPPAHHRYAPRQQHWQQPGKQLEQQPAPGGSAAVQAQSDQEHASQGPATGSPAGSGAGSRCSGRWGEGDSPLSPGLGHLSNGLIPHSEERSSLAGTMMMTVNPLFGTSRPGTAEDVRAAHAAHDVRDMLPPKRSLAAGRRRTTSQEQAEPGAGSRQHPQQQASPGALPSLGSLGSGFSALRNESEVEVQQFLRGSLAAPSSRQPHGRVRQVPQAAQHRPHPSSPLGAGIPTAAPHSAAQPAQAASPASSTGSPAAGEQAALAAQAGRWLRGSLDLTAILDSRPASPAKLVPVGSWSSEDAGSEAGPWQTARSGGAASNGTGAAGWHTARERSAASGSGCATKDEQGMWSSDSSGSSAGGGWDGGAEAAQQVTAGQRVRQHAGGARGAGAPDEPATADLQLLRISARAASPSKHPVGGASTVGTSDGPGSLAAVVQQTFPAEAVEQLGRLEAQLGRRQPGSNSPERHSAAASQSPSSGRTEADSQSAPAVLPLRDASPELPGLGISRRQACLLQSAVGRMAGNPGEGAGAADIQAALQDVLVAQTKHVQAQYRRAVEDRLAGLRRQHAHDPTALARALQLESCALQSSEEACTRRELESFVAKTLPRLAEVLSSRALLLRCFDAAAGPDSDGEAR